MRACRQPWRMLWAAAVLLFTALFHSAFAVSATNQVVTLFPSLGWSTTNGGVIKIHAWVSEPEKRRFTTAVLRKTLGLEAGPQDAASKAVFKERVHYFMGDDQKGIHATVRVAGHKYAIGPSASDGHLKVELVLTPSEAAEVASIAKSGNGFVPYELALEGKGALKFTGRIEWLAEQGTSVISDVDDTIKVTEVRDHKALLRNTFFQPLRAVEGMPDLYRAWAAQGAQFHYVSASPWQLYSPLEAFRAEQGFPAGSFHLKFFRLKDRTFLALFESPADYKWEIIEPMMRQFPERRFVLVGDSGEQDPEVYGRLARAFPQQVVKICIRNVTGEDADASRYGVAFKDVPREIWQIFTEPSAIGRDLPARPISVKP